MDTEFTGIDWERLLSAFPIPAAVLNREGLLVFSNKSIPAEVGVAGSAGDERRAAERFFAEHHAIVSASRSPLLFTRGGTLWVMIPALDRHGRMREVLAVGFESPSSGSSASLEARMRITGAMKAQLAAIAGLAGSLQSTVTGTSREQALLIEQNSRLVLRELKTLVGSNGGNHVRE